MAGGLRDALSQYKTNFGKNTYSCNWFVISCYNCVSTLNRHVRMRRQKFVRIERGTIRPQRAHRIGTSLEISKSH